MHFLAGDTNATFHWVRKLVFTFPSKKYRSTEVRNVVFPSGKLGILRLGNTSWEIRVSEPNGTQHKEVGQEYYVN